MLKNLEIDNQMTRIFLLNKHRIFFFHFHILEFNQKFCKLSEGRRSTRGSLGISSP